MHNCFARGARCTSCCLNSALGVSLCLLLRACTCGHVGLQTNELQTNVLMCCTLLCCTLMSAAPRARLSKARMWSRYEVTLSIDAYTTAMRSNHRYTRQRASSPLVLWHWHRRTAPAMSLALCYWPCVVPARRGSARDDTRRMACVKCHVTADLIRASLSARSAANKYYTRHTAIDKGGSQGFTRIETGASLGQVGASPQPLHLPHTFSNSLTPPRTSRRGHLWGAWT